MIDAVDPKVTAFSVPWNAPSYPPFPIEFRNVSIMTVIWRTDPTAIAAVLPPPLRMSKPLVAAQIYSMPDTDHMGSLNECNIMVAAEIDDGSSSISGGYSVLLLLDSDGGIAHGREVHGQPKKSGQPSLRVVGDLTVGAVERNGIRVLTATSPYKQRRSDLSELFAYCDFSENLNYKVIPNIDGTDGIRQITARRLRKIEVHEFWAGEATVELGANAQAPIWKLPVLEPLIAFHWRADFTLQPGRVVFDYLKSASA